MIVDDDKEIGKALKGLLTDEGYYVLVAHHPDEAWRLLNDVLPSVILLDVWFGKASWEGVHFLERLQAQYPMLPVIMVSGHGNLSLAVHALQKGAADFIEKPIQADRLFVALQRTMELQHTRAQLTFSKTEIAWPVTFDATWKKAAQSDMPLLIVGEKGTGKTRLAHHLHFLSQKSQGPVVILGSHLLNDLSDSLFFGSMTDHGAVQLSVFEKAQGGTVILQNVHLLHPCKQREMAHILQSGMLKRLGAKHPVPLKIRWIATAPLSFLTQTSSIQQATVSNPWQTQTCLYHRLTLAPLKLESLRDNIPMIPVWADFLLQEICAQSDQKLPSLSPETITQLKTYDWPGNIQQLRVVLEWALGQCPPDSLIEPSHLPLELQTYGVTVGPRHDVPHSIYQLPLRQARAYFELQYVKAQLAFAEGNMSKAAEVIGMDRAALHRKLKSLEHGLWGQSLAESS